MKKFILLILGLLCLTISPTVLATKTTNLYNLRVYTDDNKALTSNEIFNIEDVNSHVLGSFTDHPSDPQSEYEFTIPPKESILFVSAPNSPIGSRATCVLPSADSSPVIIDLAPTILDKNNDSVIVFASTEKKNVIQCGSFVIPRT